MKKGRKEERKKGRKEERKKGRSLLFAQRGNKFIFLRVSFLFLKKVQTEIFHFEKGKERKEGGNKTIFWQTSSLCFF